MTTEPVLPAIPAKRYFTIGEVSDLCVVKPYVLRYWEQEFSQLRPMKRRGNRRYYQHHEVLLIRRIRELLYDQGFTIVGARNQLGDSTPAPDASSPRSWSDDSPLGEPSVALSRAAATGSHLSLPERALAAGPTSASLTLGTLSVPLSWPGIGQPWRTKDLRAQLVAIRSLLED
jgi:DNA-binding transcriptional MerR regulator